MNQDERSQNNQRQESGGRSGRRNPRTQRRHPASNNSNQRQNRHSQERHSSQHPEPQRERVRIDSGVSESESGSKSILNITNLAVIAVLIGLIIFVIKIASVFGIFIFSFVIAFLLFPIVEWLDSKRIPRVWAILIVYIFFGGALFGISAAVIPAIIAQATSFLEKIPEITENFRTNVVPRIEEAWGRLQDIGIETDDLNTYLAQLGPEIKNFAMNVGQFIITGLQGAVGGIVSLLSVPIIVFYLLLDAPRIRESLMKFAPPRTGAEVQNLLNRLADMMNHYLRGQLLLSFLMFVITTILLLILGVRHALLLGVLAGITEVIPIAGPIIALIPALLAAFFEPSSTGIMGYFNIESGLIRALIVTLSYMGLQWVENNLMVPRIMGSNLNLHPLTVMFALLAGGYLAGIFGMLLGLPIAAALKVIFETYYPPFIQRVEDLIRRSPPRYRE